MNWPLFLRPGQIPEVYSQPTGFNYRYIFNPDGIGPQLQFKSDETGFTPKSLVGIDSVDLPDTSAPAPMRVNSQ
jgi:hypothetical protein